MYICNEIKCMCIYTQYVIQEHNILFRKPPLLGQPLSLPDIQRPSAKYLASTRPEQVDVTGSSLPSSAQ